jgi:hypothetical protein
VPCCHLGEFHQRQPGLAEVGRALWYQFEPGLAFLATVRRDGGPRVHQMCPLIHRGGLYAFIVTGPNRPIYTGTAGTSGSTFADPRTFRYHSATGQVTPTGVARTISGALVRRRRWLRRTALLLAQEDDGRGPLR